MELDETLFDRTIGRSRSWQITLLIAVVLYGLAFLIGSLQYGPSDFFARGHWRGILISPTIIVYVLLIAPMLTQMEIDMISAIVPLSELDQERSATAFSKTAEVSAAQEIGAIAVGSLIGAGIVAGYDGLSLRWITLYNLVFVSTVVGLLSWTVYASVVSIKVTAALLELPLRVNLLDLSPFEVVGRSSLCMALAFVGGVTLALFFSAPEPSVFQTLEFWLINAPMFVIPVIIFFWNMYPTHGIIASAKEDEIREVRHHIRAVSRQLLTRNGQPRITPQASDHLQALITYEKRLHQVQTWPYDVSTLRSLVVSVLIPGVTVLAQVGLRRALGW